MAVPTTEASILQLSRSLGCCGVGSAPIAGGTEELVSPGKLRWSPFAWVSDSLGFARRGRGALPETAGFPVSFQFYARSWLFFEALS